MSKKKLTEPEIHALIIRDVKCRLGCQDFEPDFRLHRVEIADPRRYGYANWDVDRNADTWKPDCATVAPSQAVTAGHTSRLQVRPRD